MNLKDLSVSIIIPCRNEKGNIERVITDTPIFGSKTEFIFVEGHSQDGTLEEIIRVDNKYKEQELKNNRTIKYFVQENRGKNDAVKLGFAHATGDILMILDSDLTVDPKELLNFYNNLINNKADFINGTRMINKMEKGAMPLINYCANYFFAKFVSIIINQKLTDTLCGTKVLFARDYKKIDQALKEFNISDPFGDFDLIFGAARINLKILDLPVNYKRRTYGTTQVKKFINGLILLKICLIGFKKFKFR